MPIVRPGGDGPLVVSRLWPDFKKVLDGTEKALGIQYEETDRLYQLFCTDDAIAYICQIFKEGKTPRGWSSQRKADNDSWRVDFETNWLDKSNTIQRVAAYAEHYNGTATTTAQEVVFSTTTRSILIENMGKKDLLVSFDGGNAFKTLEKGAILSGSVALRSVFLKSTRRTDYEILVTY